MATVPAFQGIRVLDFSWFGAAPIGTKCLADHGADVIRVESQTRLDSLRVLGSDGTSASACADCDDPMIVEVEDGSLVSDDAVVHFLVPPRRFWDDVGFT